MPLTTKPKPIFLRFRVPDQIHQLIVREAEDQLRTYHDQAKFLMLQGLGWRPTPIGRIHIQPESSTITVPISLRLTPQERADLQTIADGSYRPAENMAAWAIATALNCTQKARNNQ